MKWFLTEINQGALFYFTIDDKDNWKQDGCSPGSMLGSVLKELCLGSHATERENKDFISAEVGITV